MRSFLWTLLATALLFGCVQTNVTRLSTAPEGLSPVDTSQIEVYADTSSIECDYDEVAYVGATGSVANMPMSRMIQGAKPKAGKMGANALVIGGKRTQGPSYFDRYGNTESKFLAVYERRPCN